MTAAAGDVADLMGNLKLANATMAENATPGDLGRQIPVQTNVFGLGVQGERMVYLYDVKVWCDLSETKELLFTKKTKDDFIANKRKERCVNAIKHLLDTEKDFFGDKDAVWYDGQSLLFSLKDFFAGKEPAKTFTIPSTVIDKELTDLSVFVAITKSQKSSIIVNPETVTSTTANRQLEANDRHITQFLEIAVNQMAIMNPNRHKVYENGKSFVCDPMNEGFTERDCVDVGDGKRLFVGTQKSIRQIEGPHGRGYNNPSLVIDAKKAAFHESMTVIDKANKISGERFDKEIQPRSFDRISSVLKGVTVETMHLKKPRAFPITGISKHTALSHSFETKEGTKMNTAEYFKSKYDIILKYPMAPLVLTREKGNAVTYPMELLRVAPFQRVTIPQQTPEQSAKSTKECAVPPGTRQQNIMKGAASLGVFHPENPYIKNAGLAVFGNPVKVGGRVLPDLRIKYAGNEAPVEQGKWKTARTKYLIPASCPCWAVYLISNGRRDDEAMLRPFAEKFYNAAREKGMNMAVPADIRPINEKQVYEALRDAAGHNCKLVFVITPDNITSLHKSLKLWEREFCMVVQDMKSSNFGKVVRDGKFLTLENVINKTNVKLGGLNYVVNLSGFGKEAGTWITDTRLIIGIGMSHPPPAAFLEGMEVAAPTVVGYSANVKANPFEFVGDFVLQEGKRTSTLPVMDTVLENTLDMYKEQHKGAAPKEIVIYRSGVDEGSFALIISEEIPRVRNFLAAKGAAGVKIVFIVAQKEHNVRLFKEQINPNDKPTQQNVLPGTVVDTGIAHPSFKEFYLNSHTTLQGSASTPRYSVLVDDLSMSMNELEGLTYALAHDHQIVALTTSLPAPVYIANRYAERGRNVYAEYMAAGTAKASEMGDWRILTKKLGYNTTELKNVRVNA